MDDLPRLIEAETGARRNAPSPPTEPVDELEIARRRMKHLAPWHIEPRPMHRGTGAVRPGNARSDLERRLMHSFVDGASWPLDRAALAALSDLGLNPEQIALVLGGRRRSPPFTESADVTGSNVKDGHRRRAFPPGKE